MKNNKEPESLYLGQDFKKRAFPTGPKRIDMKFKETPLFRAIEEAKEEMDQLTLFGEGVNKE